MLDLSPPMRMRLAILMLLPAVAASACSSIATVQQQAPAWFDQASREIKGEGYPDLCDIPSAKNNKVNEAAWDAEAKAVRADEKAMLDRAAALGPVPTDEQIRATAAQMRADADLARKP